MFKEGACLWSAGRPFKHWASLKEKLFSPFLDFFGSFKLLYSQDSLRFAGFFCEKIVQVLWDRPRNGARNLPTEGLEYR